MSALPRTPSFRLDGRRAIVTGASRGIGLANAVALAEAGAEVTLVARSFDELETRAAEIRAAYSPSGCGSHSQHLTNLSLLVVPDGVAL